MTAAGLPESIESEAKYEFSSIDSSALLPSNCLGAYRDIIFAFVFIIYISLASRSRPAAIVSMRTESREFCFAVQEAGMHCTTSEKMKAFGVSARQFLPSCSGPPACQLLARASGTSYRSPTFLSLVYLGGFCSGTMQ